MSGVDDSLQEVLKLARAGWGVFPCRAKEPITGWHAKMRGTRDEELIRRWAARYTDCQWGGTPPEGQWVMDVDPRNGGDATLKQLLGGKRMPRTPFAQSGGGGWHYVFNSAAPAVGKLGKGLDVKRSGKGYVVVAPSLHDVTGKPYRWRVPPWGMAPAAAPAMLLAGVGAKAPPTDGQQGSDDASFAQLGRAWNKGIARDVWAALKKVDADITYPDWIRIGQALHSADPSPTGQAFETWERWSQQGAKHKPGDCLKHWRSFRRTGGITVSTVFEIAKEHGFSPKEAARAKAAVKEAAAPKKQIRIHNFGDLSGREVHQPILYVNNFLAEGAHLLIGQQKLGKTYMALQLAAALANGTPFWHQPTHRTPRVCVLALEEGGQADDEANDPVHRMQRRMQEMHLTKELKNVDLCLELDPRDDAGLSHVTELFNKYDVLIIDSLAKLEMMGTGSDDHGGNVWHADYGIIERFRRPAMEQHKLLLVITHTAKDANQRDALAAIAGTGGKLAAADGMWIFQRPDKNDPSRIRLAVLGRDIPSREYEMRWQESRRWWHLVGPWLALTEQQAAVLAHFEHNGNRWATLEALAEAIGTTANSVRQAMGALLHGHLIERMRHAESTAQREARERAVRAGPPPYTYRATLAAQQRTRILQELDNATDAVQQFDPFDTGTQEQDPFDV